MRNLEQGLSIAKAVECLDSIQMESACTSSSLES